MTDVAPSTRVPFTQEQFFTMVSRALAKVEVHLDPIDYEAAKGWVQRTHLFTLENRDDEHFLYGHAVIVRRGPAP